MDRKELLSMLMKDLVNASKDATAGNFRRAELQLAMAKDLTLSLKSDEPIKVNVVQAYLAFDKSKVKSMTHIEEAISLIRKEAIS